jgi:hypothetical protein
LSQQRSGSLVNARKRQNRAIITADVRRFGHLINTDGVLGTHTNRRTSYKPLVHQLPP